MITYMVPQNKEIVDFYFEVCDGKRYASLVHTDPLMIAVRVGDIVLVERKSKDKSIYFKIKVEQVICYYCLKGIEIGIGRLVNNEYVFEGEEKTHED